MSRMRLLIAALSVCFLQPASGHEFWLAPDKYHVRQSDSISVELRVGMMMRGRQLAYRSDATRSFTVAIGGQTRDAEVAEGDLPALTFAAAELGLHVVAYRSGDNLVGYDSWEEFRQFLAEEGLDYIAQRHRERGLPDSGFTESYSRYAKTLVQVGPVGKKSTDRASEVPLEIVAEDNPYTPGLKSMQVLLLSNGTPVAGRQIAVFRYDGKVSRSLVVTDEQGKATIPVDGGGRFLLNAVDLQPVTGSGDVAWHSHWASLTFGLPVRLADLHPLDPLSRIEIARAVRLIGESGHADRKTRVSLVTLAEPDKAEVLAWKPGMPMSRKALTIVRKGAETYEATVDLVNGRLEHWQPRPGVQPAIGSDEWAKAQRLTKADPRWLDAMRSRGYDDVSDIFCESLSAGYFDLPGEQGRRLLKMPCYDASGARTNIYGRPIEGLISVVDLNEGAVVQVIDQGAVPVSEANHEFDEASLTALRPPLKPVRDAAPSGWNFTLDGHLLSWDAWSLHLGFDQRFGAVLSLVTHEDGASRRMVLYQGHLSEVFVPYMDPEPGWYHRSYMDVGEYGLGALSSPLNPGLDCPRQATFLDAELVTPVGASYTRPRVLCAFERDPAAPLWRHWEALNGAHEGRPATELVVRSIASIGNYDYVIDWVFTRKGEIHLRLGATGIDAVKGVAVRNMQDPGAEEATRTGMLVAPNLVAVHHDHYFSVRLDIDVDGPVNTFVRERLTPQALPPGHPRRSLWRLTPEPVPGEGALSMRAGPELWRIENPTRRTALGHRPSYQISPGSRATSLLDADDWPQRRAAFSKETLWITARKPGELFAAGAYPNQSPGGDGLSRYVSGESVANTDIVAWYTLGFHHLTRPEDWPVLPTIWHTVKLRPYGFFTENPGLRTREEFLGEQE